MLLWITIRHCPVFPLDTLNRNMDLKQLRAIIAIAETGSVTRAAQTLHVVQPALSRQLRLLEKELGAPLFERTRHGMHLTDAGQTLVDHARRAMRELDRARAEVVAPGTVSGSVAIGLLPSTSALLSGKLIESLRAKYPDLNVRLTIGFAGHLQQWLESGEIDLALLYALKPSTLLDVQPLVDEVLYLVGPTNAGLRFDKSISMSDVASSPLIMPSSPHGLSKLLEHACAVAGVRLTVVTETNSMQVQKELVSHGLGFTILPSVAIFDDVANRRLSAAPITAPDLSRRIVLALPMPRRASITVRSVANELCTLIQDIISRGGWPGARWLGDA